MKIINKQLFLSIAIPVILLISTSSSSAAILSGALNTTDGISISYDHYKQGFDSCIIICPGFFNNKENRWMQKAVSMLLPEHDVIIFDFRGHGKSTGRYTWGAKEQLDVDAVINYAVSRQYKSIGILAFSLGALAAINDAATRDDIESMVMISCPTSFDKIDYHFWKPEMFYDLKDNIECKWQGKGARTTSIFLNKEAPIDSVRRIKRTKLFFIQGEKDWVVRPWHAKKLYEAAKPEKKLEIIKGGFHAERLMQFHYDLMRDLILAWLR